MNEEASGNTWSSSKIHENVIENTFFLHFREFCKVTLFIEYSGGDAFYFIVRGEILVNVSPPENPRNMSPSEK